MLSFNPEHQGPLADVRVLDLSRLVAGNMLSLYLADFGADVIKVERPGRGDDLRHWREQGHDVYWKVYGRNKRSLALDLKQAQDKQHLETLIAHSQILIENFVPGGLEKMGFSPEKLHQINPALVIARVSGWGQDGPYSHKPGFGTLVEAMSGYAHLNGYADKPPALPPLAMADMVAGIYGAAGVLTALRHAEKTGQGQVVDLSLFEPILSLIASEAAKVQATGMATMRSGNQSAHTAPRNLYLCADGRYIALSGSMQSMAERIFDTIGRPELKSDPRFVDNDARVHNKDELDRILQSFIGQREQAENLRLFEQAAVTAGPVCSMDELLTHPYVVGRQALVVLPDEQLGQVPMHNITPRLSGSPGGFRRPAPKLGEHTEEILAQLTALNQE